MLRKLVVIVFVLIVSLPVFAEVSPATVEEKIDVARSIEIAINKLLENDQSTNGQVQALAAGYDLWDAELNRVYKELVTAYGKNEPLKKSLKEAQLAWIKFRDAELDHLHNIFLTKEGSMYRIFLASDRMELIKARALELQKRYNDFTESN